MKTDEVTSIWDFSAHNNPKLGLLFNETQIDELDKMFKLVDDLPVKENRLSTIDGLMSVTEEEEALTKRRKKNRSRSEDYEPNLGKVQDTLRNDYPEMFTRPLDYSIYVEDIEVADPTGINFSGIKSYRNLFTILRFCARNIFKSQAVTFRMIYSPGEQAVRVIWHVELTSDVPFLGGGKPVYFDGVSRYYVNWEGLVYRHEVSNLAINGI